jgi:NAD(P)H-dependent flavin oxidoreductase YrpB (nitropropane dioxygenase family)
VKEGIVRGTERDTLLINRTLRNTSRVARNAISEEVARIQQDVTKTIDDVRELVAGVRGRTNVLKGGDLDGGIWTVGQSQALIRDIPTCKDLVRNIMTQAEEVVAARLDRMAAGGRAASARVPVAAE